MKWTLQAISQPYRSDRILQNTLLLPQLRPLLLIGYTVAPTSSILILLPLAFSLMLPLIVYLVFIVMRCLIFANWFLLPLKSYRQGQSIAYWISCTRLSRALQTILFSSTFAAFLVYTVDLLVWGVRLRFRLLGSIDSIPGSLYKSS